MNHGKNPIIRSVTKVYFFVDKLIFSDIIVPNKTNNNKKGLKMNKNTALNSAMTSSVLGSVLAASMYIKDPQSLNMVMTILFTSALIASVAKVIADQKRANER